MKDLKDNNNVRVVFSNKISVDFTAENIEEFKEIISNKEFRYINIGKNVSINLDNVLFIRYKMSKKLSQKLVEGV